MVIYGSISEIVSDVWLKMSYVLLYWQPLCQMSYRKWEDLGHLLGFACKYPIFTFRMMSAKVSNKKNSSKTPTFDILSSNLKDLLKTSGGKATDVPARMKQRINQHDCLQNWSKKRKHVSKSLRSREILNHWWKWFDGWYNGKKYVLKSFMSCFLFEQHEMYQARIPSIRTHGFNLVPQKWHLKKKKKNIPANSLWPFWSGEVTPSKVKWPPTMG